MMFLFSILLGLHLAKLSSQVDLTENLLDSIDPKKFQIYYKNNSLTEETFTIKNNSKIINGYPVSIKGLPYLVSLGYLSSTGYWHYCGGSIVSNSQIITLKDCFANLGKNYNYYDFYTKNGYVLALLAGSDRMDVLKIRQQLKSEIFYIIDNIDYRDSDSIAILKTSVPIKFTDSVNKAILPTTSNPWVINGQSVVAAGWGTNEKNEASPSLHYTYMNVLNGMSNENECQGYEKNNYCCKDLSTRNGNICYGDGGGPLIHYENNQWVLYGVANFIFVDEKNQCINTMPGFFATLPNSWVMREIRN
ncbi:unnamed protein product [Brachionus calyciflorus]|uniref:Peptidase S1 domain-containing protein n=1 Tax=Brachionus calyciflorus TaxID=104777 RepID=A0A813VYJ9_9BILA|nr:unnamed protein product [Brachionus calyciflorus]